MSDDIKDIGHKRVCPLCTAKYYDFYQEELDCPSCGKLIQAVNINKPKRGRKATIVSTPSQGVKENDDLKALIEETSEDDENVTNEQENLSEDISIDIIKPKEGEEAV